MTILAPFNPSYTQGQIVTPAAGAASVTINAQSKQVCLTNLGSNICYVRVGTGAFSATTADYPIAPLMQQVVTKADGDDKVSYISAGGTTLHIMPGGGF